VRHWNRLAREDVDAPFLELFKVRLVGALSNLVPVEGVLACTRGLGTR